MKSQLIFWWLSVCIIILLNVLTIIAQTSERRQPPPASTPTSQTQELPGFAPAANPTETLTIQIGQLRESLKTLNTRLRVVIEKLTAAGKAAELSPGKTRFYLI